MCLTLGASSEVIVEDSARQRVGVMIDGKPSDAAVTKEAIARLTGNKKFRISVNTSTDLPQSQGFGMSAAGALSASIALADIIGESREKAFQAAHIAEIVKGGGLGDVSALHRGGITIRKRPGLPPIGEVIRIDGEPEVVLCVVGRRMLTKSILTNPQKRRAINSSGSQKVDLLLKRPSIHKLLDLSAEFTIESGLATRNIIAAMNAASRLGAASMSMLGNSVFALGDRDGLVSVLSEMGETWVCRVDTRGPRLL